MRARGNGGEEVAAATGVRGERNPGQSAPRRRGQAGTLTRWWVTEKAPVWVPAGPGRCLNDLRARRGAQGRVVRLQALVQEAVLRRLAQQAALSAPPALDHGEGNRS
jgi:hypothetical protein